MTQKIETHFVYPPIPIRCCDWQVTFDHFDGAEDSGWQCVGSGETEFLAMVDFYDNFECHCDEALVAERKGFAEDLGMRP